MNPNPTVLGVIPARGHSTRFPFKVIAKIRNKPMIQWVWQNAQASHLLQKVVVATDHTDIEAVAKGFGAEVYLTPTSLKTGSDRVAFVGKDFPHEIIVNIQGDEPLLNAPDLDLLIQSLQANANVDMATLMVHCQKHQGLEDPNTVKVVTSQSGQALYFSRQPLAISPEGEFYKHIGIYAYRREALFKFCSLPSTPLEKTEKLEQLRALENGMRIQLVEIKNDTIAVDIPEDLMRVEQLLTDREQLL